jgi:hypothetical protein
MKHSLPASPEMEESQRDELSRNLPAPAPATGAQSSSTKQPSQQPALACTTTHMIGKILKRVMQVKAVVELLSRSDGPSRAVVGSGRSDELQLAQSRNRS